jgi:hypothetical protein
MGEVATLLLGWISLSRPSEGAAAAAAATAGAGAGGGE